MDEAHAPSSAVASHKATNPWFKAFELVYDGVASDCSVPTGKNRFHKFKDKIVELWTAMEHEAPDDHPLKPRALEQLSLYRQACEEAQKAELNDGKSPGKASLIKKAPMGTAAMKRPYSSTFHPTTGRMWKHLDESSALQKLPEPLKSLTHLRHMATEIGASGAKQDVEVQYMAELYNYLAESNSAEPFARAQILTALYRLSQSAKEAKDILAAYERSVQEYLVQMAPPSSNDEEKAAEV